MANVVSEDHLILADLVDNHNKFWNIYRYDDNSIRTHWGRIGDAGCSKDFPHYSSYEAEKFYEIKMKEKERKGYRKQQTLANFKIPTFSNVTLTKVAKEQIQTNSPETVKLVEKLVKANVHNILSATTLTYNDVTGLFSTPLGIVTGDAITTARRLLDDILGFVEHNDYSHYRFQRIANDYLNIIPQVIARRKPSVETIFPDKYAVQKQFQILDSLEGSLQVALKSDDDTVQEKVFAASLELVTDTTIFNRLNKMYRDTLKSGHSCSHLQLKNVYSVDIEQMRKEFVGDKVGNVQELWHGSRVGNLLSILKSGFVIPPSNSAHVCGRLFKDGVYFANSSTKSLNYSYGYWGGERDNNCFMFLCDVAIGKYYVPQYGQGIPVGYDSLWAKAGISGVMNDEIVVPRTNQINSKYLMEFSG